MTVYNWVPLLHTAASTLDGCTVTSQFHQEKWRNPSTNHRPSDQCGPKASLGCGLVEIMRCDLEGYLIGSRLTDSHTDSARDKTMTNMTDRQGCKGTETDKVQNSLFSFFFFFFRSCVWWNLIGWPPWATAALPPHHFRDRIYCCSLGAKPSASEDSVWMTSQLCNRPTLARACAPLWGNFEKDGWWCV